MYPTQYKPLLRVLRETPATPIPELIRLFPPIREDVQAHRDRTAVTVDDLDITPIEYDRARQIVARTVDHPGYIETNDTVYDSIDDCADLLIDLAEIEQFETRVPAPDVWHAYISCVDSHLHWHMRDLEIQAKWITERK